MGGISSSSELSNSVQFLKRFAALSDGELDGVERLVDVVDVDDGVDTVDDCLDFAFLVFLGVVYEAAVAATMRGAFLIFGIVWVYGVDAMCSDWDFVQGSVDVVLLLKKLCDDLRGNICPKLGWFRHCNRQQHILAVCKCMHLLNMDILLNIVINT